MSTPSDTRTEAASPERLVLINDPMYTVEDVAAVLKMGVASAWKLISAPEGGVPDLLSVQVGRLRRIRKSDLDAYIAGLVPSAPARTRGTASDAA